MNLALEEEERALERGSFRSCAAETVEGVRQGLSTIIDDDAMAMKNIRMRRSLRSLVFFCSSIPFYLF